MSFIMSLNPAMVIGVSGIVIMIANWILSKFKIPKKISRWLDIAEVWLEDILNQIMVTGGMLGYNLGVSATAWLNRLPVIGTVYEKLIEPLLIIILEGVIRLATVLLDKLSSIVLKFLNRFIIGMKSDNIKFKKGK